MTKKRDHFEDAFKLEVAKMVVDQGLAAVTVASQMNVGRSTVGHWAAQYRAELLGQRCDGTFLSQGSHGQHGNW